MNLVQFVWKLSLVADSHGEATAGVRVGDRLEAPPSSHSRPLCEVQAEVAGLRQTYRSDHQHSLNSQIFSNEDLMWGYLLKSTGSFITSRAMSYLMMLSPRLMKNFLCISVCQISAVLTKVVVS